MESDESPASVSQGTDTTEINS